jgi:hypothetical protein
MSAVRWSEREQRWAFKSKDKVSAMRWVLTAQPPPLGHGWGRSRSLLPPAELQPCDEARLPLLVLFLQLFPLVLVVVLLVVAMVACRGPRSTVAPTAAARHLECERTVRTSCWLERRQRACASGYPSPKREGETHALTSDAMSRCARSSLHWSPRPQLSGRSSPTGETSMTASAGDSSGCSADDEAVEDASEAPPGPRSTSSHARSISECRGFSALAAVPREICWISSEWRAWRSSSPAVLLCESARGRHTMSGAPLGMGRLATHPSPLPVVVTSKCLG